MYVPYNAKSSISIFSYSAMRTAWVDGVYDAEVLHELNTAVDEMAALLRCRKALCDEGLKALLELLNSMKTHHVWTLCADLFILWMRAVSSNYLHI